MGKRKRALGAMGERWRTFGARAGFFVPAPASLC